ncbi:MAG: 50S ribosomal protein L18 [Euryarchaeota archaeon RBG_16_62_10]|nr:MAG: 50S ribosomal protein L18 [Euryarchaeota archaeon RBG_16_62_10]
MATGPRYRVPFRRRREGRTDYRHRAALLRGGVVRAVVRKSNRNIMVQFVEYKDGGDFVLASAVSTDLEEFGWTGSGKSTPGAYLTGLLAGKRAREKGLDEAVLDIGLREPTKGAVVFAALKGIIDAGVEVPHSDKMLPPEDRLTGKHMREGTADAFAGARTKIGGAGSD